VTPTIKANCAADPPSSPSSAISKPSNRMGRNYLWFWHGDANNALLAAVGYNIRRLVRWLRILLRQFLSALLAEPLISPA
jgi:transposase, IS5 family